MNRDWDLFLAEGIVPEFQMVEGLLERNNWGASWNDLLINVTDHVDSLWLMLSYWFFTRQGGTTFSCNHHEAEQRVWKVFLATACSKLAAWVDLQDSCTTCDILKLNPFSLCFCSLQKCLWRPKLWPHIFFLSSNCSECLLTDPWMTTEGIRPQQ